MTIATFSDLIGENGLFIDGDWVESKDQDPDGDVRLIQLADVGVGKFINKSSRFMTSSKAAKLKCTYLKPGDILIARMPDPIGRACIFPGDEKPCVTVVDVCIVRVDPSIVDTNWLVHFINSNVFQRKIANWVTGTTRQRVSRGNLSKVEIPLPPLEEQKRIAAILDKADAIRRKRQQAIDLTDQLLRAVFLDMFGDPVMNPKGWEKLPLEDVVKKVIDCPHSTPNWTDSGKVAIRTSNLTVGGWDWEDTRYVCEEEFHDRSKRAYVKPGDVVLSREGTVGIAAIVEENMEICLGQRLVQLVPDSNTVISEYLLHILLYELEPERIERVMVGATSKHINVKELRAMKIPVPPIETQEKFKDIINQIGALRTKFNIHCNKDNDLFKSLTQQAFCGGLSKSSKAA